MTAAQALAEREALVATPGPGGPGARAALTQATDTWLGELFALGTDEAAGSPDAGICLVAVGGHGRSELGPRSDLDVLLLHRGDERRAAGLAERIWYPIWDAGIALDHSVRSVAQARRLASEDAKVLLGLLDARPVAGDAGLVADLCQAVLGDLRAMAGKRLSQVRALVQSRRERFGDLATMLEPDLKQAYGGLREASVLRAIAASWITDIPHAGWESEVQRLLDIRDALQATTGRPGNVLRLQEQDAVAAALALADADDLLRQAYAAARTIAYASDAAWHRVDRLAAKAPRLALRQLRRSGPTRVPLADGVVVQDGEAMLAADAHPDRDPVLALRLAAAAAQAGLPVAPHAVQRLARESAQLPVPWSHPARDAFVSLLGAGESTVRVWEALDQAGVIDRWIPGWEVIRSAPQRNAVHRFTVDRHLVEAVVQASALTRTVQRPDLLLVAALLHDFGKARGGDHSIVGAQLAAGIVPRLGFPDDDTAVIVRLVRHHLLLADTATRRDIEDPATIADVAEAVEDPEFLDLLAALTEADSIATGPAVWTQWRRSLIGELVRRVHASLAGRPLPQPPELTPDQVVALGQDGVWVLMGQGEDGTEVTVAAPDQVGLLAAVAGVLSINRLQVRGARVQTIGDRAVQVWTVEPAFGEPPAAERIAEDVRRALDGSLDVEARLRARDEAYRPTRAIARAAPRVEVIASGSDRSTILEVRAHDEPGLLHRIATAIAEAQVTITGAKVATLGSEAVDVFFVADRAGRPLRSQHAEAVQVAVRACLEQPIA
ncbi:MAG: [protein-PII] uridylyltransferase [Actinomycetales bacterium]|nr:[protein-PII] uridylyltransferase [Actinomycetales bacterium]